MELPTAMVSYQSHVASNGKMENIRLGFWFVANGKATGLLAGFQTPPSSCSCTRMLVMSGRVDDGSEDSNSSFHVWTNNAHSASENPTAGRSGRVPLKIFCMTATSGLIYSKGLRPVITCRGKSRLHDKCSRAVILYMLRVSSSQGHICPSFWTATFSGHV